MPSRGFRIASTLAGLAGVAGVVALHWMVFFWVPTEASMGIIQRIFYVHVPSAWVSLLAFGLVAMFSAVYLWLGDLRLDEAAASAAEGGLVFGTLMLISGPLWARVAWGTFWTWEPRLTLTLLVWFIYLGYFLVRASADNPDRGRRLSAVVGIVGALFIPLIHLSVYWFRSLHPQPVVLKPEGPTLDPRMFATLMVGLLAFTLVFVAVASQRYAYGLAREALASRTEEGRA